MSQKVTRKTSAASEDKDKRQTDSPVKEMKKKMAANAEKEKQAAEKNTEKSEKPAEKPAEKRTEKNGGVDKSDKKESKQEKKETHAEKSHAQDKGESKGEKSGKDDKDKASKDKPKQNGSKAHNGVSDVTLANASANGASANGTVSEDDDDVMLVIDYEHEQDELFPELTYDDTSDVECFEPATPESAPSRSFTRRSQVKAARTPETPRPASDKQETAADDPKLKLKDDAASTDRKLRSSDSPKKETKKTQSPKKDKESGDKDEEKKGENDGKANKVEVEVVVDVETEEEPRKTDTNYSKSRVKVSPYRRSTRIADNTASSMMANYTGNNTTMEMDLTETSSFAEDPSLDDSAYLSGLRNIRGRRSYKPLKEMTLRHINVNRSARSNASTSVTEIASRPTAPVVGRKRKPEQDDSIELATEVGETIATAHTKRMRLLDRIAHPFRRTLASTPLPARRNAEIVGINTDLPLTAPVASPDTFDPESLKTPAVTVTPPTPAPQSVATPVASEAERDAKRCVVM